MTNGCANAGRVKKMEYHGIEDRAVRCYGGNGRV